MIELEHIDKIYRMGRLEVAALRDVSLSIAPGEFVAITGQSGSGKSTLLHILGLLDRPTSGRFLFSGRDVSRLDDAELAALRSGEIGFVFQQFHLLRRTNAVDNVNLPLVYSPEREEERGMELLRKVGLADRARHRPGELSGGQQQRVAIARSLVRNPRLLLADEPTGNLDSSSGGEIMALFRELNSEGITVVLVTHEPEIAALARREIRIADGRVERDVSKAVAVALPELPARPTARPRHVGRLRRIRSHFHQAVRALLLNKMRTFLSAIGIIIGVGAVIGMLSLGKGAQASIADQLSGIGSNRLSIRPEAQTVGGVVQQIGGVSRITQEQAEEILAKVPLVKAAAASVRGRGQVVWRNANANTEIIGTMPGYADIYNAPAVAGRFFTAEENRRRDRVALVGRTVAEKVFGNANPVGETIKLNKVPFRVIGVLKPRGDQGPWDADDVVVIPLQTAMYRVMGKRYVDSIDVAVRDSDMVDQAQAQIWDLFSSWPKAPGVIGEGFRIANYASMQEAFTSIIRSVSILLATVAAISLVVGGIGVMNIMLVSVTERTREIGLRKALGANNGDILAQFLVEAVTLCLGGGAIGLGLGVLLTYSGSWLTGWSLSVTAGSVVLAVGFSVAVGLVFGIWPARKASLLNPIEALRHE
ncbi:MAG: ATP-binding cassette domain-containing protein [Chthoniobacterales bacterium]|nr:ATP-binding cassette domain-containing protein [Chthoniobacterales bacterium]